MGRRFINVKGFTHNGVAYDTIVSVDYNENAKRITDSGDADKYIPFQASGVVDVDVTVSLNDPFQAQQLRRAAEADVVFKGEDGQGGEKTVTITKFQAFSYSGKNMHNDKNTYTVKGNARSTDGQAPIINEEAS